jgi:hypothetical protein
MIIRAFAFVSVLVLALSTPAWFVAVCMLAYALVWRGTELFLISIFVDAHFGGFGGGLPYLYTVIVGLLLCVTTLLKPHIRFYDEYV